MTFQLFLWGALAAIGATLSFCSSADKTDHIEALGRALTDVDRAPLGAAIRLEGKLTRSGDLVRHPPTGKSCVASFSRVTLVTEESNNDDTDYYHYRAFRAVRGPDQLIIEGRGRKVAVPLSQWSPVLGAHHGESERWPRWLGDNYRVKHYRGSVDHYEIDSLCLHAGDRLFVSGVVVAVYDGAVAEAVGDVPLAEVRDPIVVLRHPVELWPGTEESRLRDLRHRRALNRMAGTGLGAVSTVLLGLGVLVVLRRRSTLR